MNTPPPKPRPSTSITRQNMRVLLVDDDSFQLDLISGILEGLGISNVNTAASGALALKTMSDQHHHIDLLVMDLHMPGMDGFEFMEAVAQTGYKGALIIVSGQSDDVMRAATLVAKLRRFTLLGSVPKPVGRSELSALISQLA